MRRFLLFTSKNSNQQIFSSSLNKFFNPSNEIGFKVFWNPIHVKQLYTQLLSKITPLI